MTSPTTGFDVERVRRDFPILQRRVHSKPLVYLDNAASSQRPQVVIDRLTRYASEEHANIHRGVHSLSQQATSAYEQAREVVAAFLNAPDSRQCLFTRGTTEAINLVASAWGSANIRAGDEIVLTQMEHHANIVPWQLLAERTGARIVVTPVTGSGDIDLEAYASQLSERTKLVAFVQVSNALGTINPVAEMTQLARKVGATVLLDGAQSTPHLPVDVQALDCDFFMFSGHKVGGPTGIGVLYGKAATLSAMQPYQGGGDMIERVSFSGTTYRGLPERFEAGTPNIEGAIALATALEYLSGLDRQAAEAHERDLLANATEQIQGIDGVRLYGVSNNKVSVLSFLVDGAHPSDLGIMLDLDGIAVRTGHHCCMPLWEHYGITGTTRASFAYYNTHAEVDALIASLRKCLRLLT